VAAEVKWHNLNRTGDLADRLANVLVECGVTAFVVELRKREGQIAEPALFASPEDVYAAALMLIAERFQRFLVHVGDYGAIILDHREGTQDEPLRRFFRRLADNGTPYIRLERIVDPILLSPSHHTLGDPSRRPRGWINARCQSCRQVEDPAAPSRDRARGAQATSSLLRAPPTYRRDRGCRHQALSGRLVGRRRQALRPPRDRGNRRPTGRIRALTGVRA
jgi:hypothetical protein